MQVIARRKQTKPTTCYFTVNNKTPYFGDVETLKMFLTPRGKILGRSKTGITAKNQRMLSIAIKRARELGLL